MKILYLIFLPLLALAFGSGAVISIHYVWHGENYYSDFVGIAAGCYLAVLLPPSFAKSAKKGWAIYGLAFCLLYSAVNWLLVFGADDAFSLLPLAIGSLVGGIAGYYSARDEFTQA